MLASQQQYLNIAHTEANVQLPSDEDGIRNDRAGRACKYCKEKRYGHMKLSSAQMLSCSNGFSLGSRTLESQNRDF